MCCSILLFKSVEAAAAETETVSPAPKERMGRRLSTRLGGFFGKKEAKSVQSKDANIIETVAEAADEPTEPSGEPKGATILETSAEATSKPAEPAAEMKAADTGEPVEAINGPSEPIQTTGG